MMGMDARHKALILQHGPVGDWRTSAGTADALGASDVRFNPDGTGMVLLRSMMHGTEKVPFLWAMAEPARLRIRYRPKPGEAPDDPDEWHTLRLEFQRQCNDIGELDVLAQVGALEGFWFLLDPLRWVGPVGDAAP